MTKITAAVRANVRAALARSRFDPDTMQISRHGMVSASRDPDKSHFAHKAMRINIGDVNYVLTVYASRVGA